MPEAGEMTRTMRIDLIPDTPTEPVPNKRRVVVSKTQSENLSTIARPSFEREPDRFSALLESIYDAALITDLQGNIVDSNVRATEFLRWETGELNRLTIRDVISGAEENLLEMLLQTLQRQRFILIQAYCERKDGTWFPSEIAVARLRTGAENLGFFMRDITVRRQAEEMLRTEHNAIQNAANGIAIANMHGVLEYVNPAFARMMESPDQNDLVGVSIKELFDGNVIADDLLAAVLGEQGSWTGEVSAEMPSGGTVDMQILANCNRNSDGEKVGVVFSFTDLSDRKRAEAAQREADRNRVMLESLGTACHHLGQPATMLMGNLSLLQSKIEARDPDVTALLEGSVDAVRRLGDTLHKLNQVNEYHTTLYMDNAGETDSDDTSRILQI